MREVYERIFQTYLRICKKKRELPTTEELKEAIKTAERFENELIGMLFLMLQCGEISNSEDEKERDRVVKEFSTITLYNAWMEYGEVCCFQEASHG